jgi:hypothetical protein
MFLFPDKKKAMSVEILGLFSPDTTLTIFTYAENGRK